MSDRDELAEIIGRHEKPGFTTRFVGSQQRTVWDCVCGWKSDEQVGFDSIVAKNHIADAILAAGYRKPRMISTEVEALALPEGAVIRSLSGDVFEMHEPEYGKPYGYGIAEESGTFIDGWHLPATVLYTPEEPR
ncbi:hypothetical protein M1M07_23755 [Rhodococcus sp. HM1]|uniref:hypothetical protein n=1 Tax=Rhodococcus sp. HM1 TaxID=2937759 RepID=UPI00200A3790|nr:hypothetical protein [Rhodococcus sp. HM1]MCK8674113.1 hypothetical protein [Rhodococcus sp. HM1]